MFETLQKAPADKIFALVAAFRADARPEKIDLGIGVYKDAEGETPIMRAVRTAEHRLIAAARTKTYVGVAGNKGFCDAVTGLVLDSAADTSNVAAVQAPGGTGALWVLLQLIKRARPDGRVLISDPSWPNHKPMCDGVGLDNAAYPYFDAATGTVRFEDMLAALDGLGPNDIVLLHACCHNPTGANLTPDQWNRVTDSLKRTGALPLVDLAYLGFGEGLDEDAYGTRELARELPEVMIAFSASKNFGLYRERTGCAIALTKSPEAAAIVQSQMGNIVRTSYSQPPDHGAEIVRLILTDPELRAEWQAELTEMRDRMKRLRVKLADAIRERSNAQDFDFIAAHRGMFSLLGLPPGVVDHLKNTNAIYMIGDSRINVAGIPEDRVGELANAILAAVSR